MTKFFIIDTNTLLSALILPNSVPKKAFLKVEHNGSIIFLEATFAELDEVIRRPKFEKYISLENRLLFLDSIKRTALFF